MALGFGGARCYAQEDSQADVSAHHSLNWFSSQATELRLCVLTHQGERLARLNHRYVCVHASVCVLLRKHVCYCVWLCVHMACTASEKECRKFDCISPSRVRVVFLALILNPLLRYYEPQSSQHAFVTVGDTDIISCFAGQNCA